MSRPGPARAVTYLLALVVLAVGVAGVVAGERDDSPGLQLIGALLGLGAVLWAVRTARRARVDPGGGEPR